MDPPLDRYLILQSYETTQLLHPSEQTLLLAVEETENALTSYVEEQLRGSALTRSVEAATKSAELVETLYLTGLTDFQNLLDMQRALFLENDKLAESKGTKAGSDLPKELD